MKVLEEVKPATQAKMKKPELLAPGNLEKLKSPFIMVQMLYSSAVKSMGCVQMRTTLLWTKFVKVLNLQIVTVLKFM